MRHIGVAQPRACALLFRLSRAGARETMDMPNAAAAAASGPVAQRALDERSVIQATPAASLEGQLLGFAALA